MGGLKPLWVRVGSYIVTVNAIVQFIVLMFTDAAVPKWSILATFALLALYAGEVAEEQWKLARRARRQWIRDRDWKRAQLREYPSVTLVDTRKVDDDEHPS